MGSAAKPVVSVVMVVDYAVGSAAAWGELRRTLEALAGQDFDEPVEYLYVDEEGSNRPPPPDVLDILPGIKVLWRPGTTSYDLLNAGMRAATADIIAILDPDCVPDGDWLRVLVAGMREHPEAAVVNGLTTYMMRSRLEHIVALVDRGENVHNRVAPVKFITKNNSAYRREVVLAHPLSSDAGPFGVGRQAESILQAGGTILYQPGMRVIHAYEGWGQLRDSRRHQGYATVALRLLDPTFRYAGIVRLGMIAIPAMVAYRLVGNLVHSFRARRQYGVRWYELPVAVWFAVVVGALEIPGMIRAYRRRPIVETEFR